METPPNFLALRSPIPIDEDNVVSARSNKNIGTPTNQYVPNARPSISELFDFENDLADDASNNSINRSSSPKSVNRLTKSISSPTTYLRKTTKRLPSQELNSAFSQDSVFLQEEEDENAGLTFVHDNATLRERSLDCLHNSGMDRVLDFVQAIFSLLACILYVIQAYNRNLEMNFYVLFIELFIGCFFFFDYILAFFLAENKRKFVFSYISLIDIASIVPVFLDVILFIQIQQVYVAAATTTTANVNITSTNITSNNGNAINNGVKNDGVTNFDDYTVSTDGEYRYNLNILRIVRVFRIFRILRGWKYLDRNLIHISYKYVRVIFLLICILFCSAGLFQQIENAQDLDLIECIYFTIVTLTTLGYGDIKPMTIGGKIFVVVLMISVGVLVPNQITKLNELRKKEHANKKFKSTTNNGHILLCGNLSPNSLLSFLHEIYGMTHGKQDLPLCILTSAKPSPIVKSIIKGRWLRDRVSILVGSTLVENDLKRCMIHEAVACFLIAETNAIDPGREDTKIVLGATNIRKYNNTVPIFACVLGGKESTQRLCWAIGEQNGSHAFSYGLVRQFLVGTNINCPGAAPLISNLLRSYSLPSLREEDVLRNKSFEYQWGVGFEIYPMTLGVKFHGRLFSHVSKVVYAQFGAIFIGLGRGGDTACNEEGNTQNIGSNQSSGRAQQILLNPYKEKIQRNDVGFFIARSALHITQIDNHFTKAALLYGQHGPGFVSNDFLVEQNALTATNTRLRAKVTNKFTPGRVSAPKIVNKREESYRSRYTNTGTVATFTVSKSLRKKNRANSVKSFNASPRNGDVNGINDSIELQPIDKDDLNLSFLGEEEILSKQHSSNIPSRLSFELDTRDSIASPNVLNPMLIAKNQIAGTNSKVYSKTVNVVEHHTNHDLQTNNHRNVNDIFNKELNINKSLKRTKRRRRRKQKRTSIEIVDDIDLLRDNGKIINLRERENFNRDYSDKCNDNDKNDDDDIANTIVDEVIPVSLLSLKAMSLFQLRDLNIVLKGRPLKSAIVKHVEFKNHIIVSCQCHVADIFHIISRLRLKTNFDDNSKKEAKERHATDFLEGSRASGKDDESKYQPNSNIKPQPDKSKIQDSVEKILIMSNCVPTEEEWELLCHFPEVYWFVSNIITVYIHVVFSVF
jgi:hypothetical protein